MAAGGAVRSLRSQGPNGLSDVASACSQIAEHVIEVLDGPHERVARRVPLVTFGAAFSRCAPSERAERWRGWPRVAAVVPSEWILRTSEGRGHGVVNNLVGPSDAPRAVLDRIESAVDSLRRRAAGASPLRSDRHQPRLAWTPEESYDSWSSRVRHAITAAHVGALRKVVLARSARAVPPAGRIFDPLATLARLRQRHPSATVFAFGQGDGSTFLGATPETLARVSGRRVRTHALAGTARRSPCGPEDARLGAALLDSAKDAYEHALVVDAIDDALKTCCLAVDRPGPPGLLRLPGIQHLCTPLTGRLRDGRGLFDVAAALHPTPAVGGTPADVASAWLEETEPMDRGWYCGPIGWVDSEGGGALCVAIRSALVTRRAATAFAGAGIVVDSSPRGEWDETALKLRTVTDGLVCAPDPGMSP